MPMDRSRCKAIVDRAAGDLTTRLGIAHWTLKFTFNAGDGETRGDVWLDVDYDRARVNLNPEAFDEGDEAAVLETLRHELFHVVASPLDVVFNALRDHLEKHPDLRDVVRSIRTHADERIVIHLDRMYRGLTAPSPGDAATTDRLAVERDAYKEAFRNAFVAYLVAGHKMTDADASAEAARVMAETDRRIAEQP